MPSPLEFARAVGGTRFRMETLADTGATLRTRARAAHSRLLFESNTDRRMWDETFSRRRHVARLWKASNKIALVVYGSVVAVFAFARYTFHMLSQAPRAQSSHFANTRLGHRLRSLVQGCFERDILKRETNANANRRHLLACRHAPRALIRSSIRVTVPTRTAGRKFNAC